ncbi:MAG: universal stress protein [Nitrososphaera sp.]|jgi:nucleotide-binding universal stress UspA family protein
MSGNAVHRILVPVDGSENSFRAASFAIDLAKRYGAELAVINALDLHQTFAQVGFYGLAFPSNIPEMIETAKKEALPWFEKIRKEAEGSDVKMQSEVIEAPLSVASQIVNYAENRHIDIIVMGSRGQTGIKRLLLGSVASAIVTYAPCPVLVVR